MISEGCLFYNKKVSLFTFMAGKHIQMIEKQQEKQKALEYIGSSALGEFHRNPFTCQLIMCLAL